MMAVPPPERKMFMKKLIKIKLLLVFAVLCLMPMTNAAGMEAKAQRE